MDNIEPWCISRQLWWGHQIPAWYGPDREIFVDETEEGAKKKAKEHYKKDVELIRDPDVLDTWFSSGLWPFATLGWPEKNEYLEKFYPTSVLVTGFDIIFFWVARMMMFGMEFQNKEPFKNIYVHALVRDEKGQKMSKSKGNVIDPLELIEKYSADALRFTLLSMASPGRDVKLSEDRVKGYRNFLNKIWNANNLLIQNDCKFENIKTPDDLKLNINKWIFIEFINTNKKIKKSIDSYRFDEAARIAYQFVWHSFCDWYLELSKTIFYSENNQNIEETRNVASYVFAQILVILHPFIPFLTEEIWLKNKLDKDGEDFLMLKNWSDATASKDKDYDEVNEIIEFVSAIRSFKNEIEISPGSFVNILIDKINPNIKEFIERNSNTLKKIGRINEFLNEDIKKPSANLIIKGEIFKIYFDEDIELSKIKTTLLNKKSKIEKEMERINTRLNNKSFIERAPNDIVEQEKSNFINLEKDVNKLNYTLESL